MTRRELFVCETAPRPGGARASVSSRPVRREPKESWIPFADDARSWALDLVSNALSDNIEGKGGRHTGSMILRPAVDGSSQQLPYGADDAKHDASYIDIGNGQSPSTLGSLLAWNPLGNHLEKGNFIIRVVERLAGARYSARCPAAGGHGDEGFIPRGVPSSQRTFREAIGPCRLSFLSDGQGIETGDRVVYIVSPCPQSYCAALEAAIGEIEHLNPVEPYGVLISDHGDADLLFLPKDLAGRKEIAHRN